MCKIAEVFRQEWKETVWIICQVVIVGYLCVLSVLDVRWKRVSVRSLFLLFGIACACQMVCGRQELLAVAAGVVCGGIFLLLSFGTKEAFGYGDSILILILGILTGGWNLLWILFAAFLLSSVYSLVMILRKRYTRKSSFPFFPFLTLAYLGGVISGAY